MKIPDSAEFWNGFLAGTITTMAVVAVVLYLLGTLVGA